MAVLNYDVQLFYVSRFSFGPILNIFAFTILRFHLRRRRKNCSRWYEFLIYIHYLFEFE